jgi:hypothetical protein
MGFNFSNPKNSRGDILVGGRNYYIAYSETLYLKGVCYAQARL